MTPASPVVRRLAEADLPAVGALAGGLLRLHHTWDPARFLSVENPERGYAQYFRSQLAEPDAVLLVAEIQGEIAGYFYGAYEARDWNMLLDAAGHLHDVFVADAHRRTGLAEKLCRAGMEALRERGAKRFVAHVWIGNDASRALTKRLGFRETMVEVMAEAEAEAEGGGGGRGDALPSPGSERAAAASLVALS